MVCPRSGLAAKYGITVLNAPGIIDNDYRGEIKVLLTNPYSPNKGPYAVQVGERIAQLVIMQQPLTVGYQGEIVNNTERGQGGFGSTGS